MRGLWLEDRVLSMREDLPEPEVGPGEALVRVRLSGVCGTDLELIGGYYPFTGIIGHEFVGEVVAAENATWIGQRVVGDINASCGACEACTHGRPTHCTARTVLGIVGRGGVHAQLTALPVGNLHRVPDSVPDEAAVFTEPLAAAIEILEQVHVRPGERVLLVGAGRLGQLIAQVLALTGAKLAVVARHQHQRDLLAARDIDVLAEDEVDPGSWDIVVEATGSPSGFALARTALRARGTLVLKSTYRGDLTLDMSSIVVDEITLIGSRCGPFEPALRLLESGQVDPLPLIAERYPLTEGMRALERAGQRGAMKVLLEP